MAEVVVKFENVTKVYKLYKSDKQRLLGTFIKKYKPVKKVAVNNVTFDINKGEAVAIFGKNGAGKSTVLKMITGVCFPTKGEVEVKGIVSALLELTSGFDKEATGLENIYLKGRILGLKESKIKKLEEKIVDFAELGEYIHQPVRTYSSGMMARLGFSISVNINPQILIVDEALSVGDTDFKNKCLKKVKKIMSKKDVTLLFVTHSVEIARQFCQRGIILKKGKLVFDGGIDEAIEKYTAKPKEK